MNWLRKEFKNVCLLANLNENYETANNYIGNGKHNIIHYGKEFVIKHNHINGIEGF